MLTADPRQHLKTGTPDKRCWNCEAWVEPEVWPATAQPLGDCTKVIWMDGDARQMTHADDCCAKHKAVHGRTLAEAEEWAVQAGLG